MFNDHAYGNIKQEELFKFGEGHYYGVDLFRGADYAGVAKALGLGAEKIASAAELHAAVERAQMHDGSYMIEVDFDGSYTIWPEAFLWNKENLIAEIDQFDAALSQMRNALVANDRDKLEEMFRLSTQRRAAFDKKAP